MAAAYVAYFGSFMNLHCLELVLSWIQCCKELVILAFDDLSLINVLAYPFEIRQWYVDSLSRESVNTTLTFFNHELAELL